MNEVRAYYENFGTTGMPRHLGAFTLRILLTLWGSGPVTIRAALSIAISRCSRFGCGICHRSTTDSPLAFIHGAQF